MKTSQNIFYNYIYLNPLKPGKFTYPDITISFLYEPFYVGKGKNKRYRYHLYDLQTEAALRSNNNKHKRNTINKIIQNDKSPFILLLNFTTNEADAYLFEKMLISSIGRRDLKNGPLTNMSDGGEGNKGLNHTIETKEKISKSLLLGISNGTIKTKTEKKSKAAKKNFQDYSASLKGKTFIEIHGEEKAKQIISLQKANRAPFKHTPESKQKLSDSAKLRDNTNYKGDKNGMATPISIKINEIIFNFGYLKECYRFILNNYYIEDKFCKKLRKNGFIKVNDDIVIYLI